MGSQPVPGGTWTSLRLIEWSKWCKVVDNAIEKKLSNVRRHLTSKCSRGDDYLLSVFASFVDCWVLLGTQCHCIRLPLLCLSKVTLKGWKVISCALFYYFFVFSALVWHDLPVFYRRALTGRRQTICDDMHQIGTRMQVRYGKGKGQKIYEAKVCLVFVQI